MKKASTRKGLEHVKATIRIGKKGIGEAQIKEISKQLEARKKVKIKVLKSALMETSIEEIAKNVSFKTGSKIIQIIGHTFTLYKPKRKKENKTSQLNVRAEENSK